MNNDRTIFCRSLTAVLYTGVLCGAAMIVAGCEAKGPAQSAGENIDKGVQSAQDAIDPPGALEKAGRSIDKTIDP